MLIPKNFKKGEIKTIVFDFGNVILDLDIPHCINEFVKLGAGAGTMNEAHKLFIDQERGEYKQAGFLAALRSHAPQNAPEVSDEQLLAAWNSLLHKPIDPRRIALINQLRADGYRLVLLSNTNDIHREFFFNKFFEEMGINLDALFDKTFFSDLLHCRKPEPQIYKLVNENARLVPAQTLFIDDKAENTEGAAKIVGWHTHTLAVGKETILDLFEEK